MERSTLVYLVLALVSLLVLFIGILVIERARRKGASDALRAAAVVNDKTGELFFQSLTEHLGSVLKADYVSIGELSEDGSRIKTVATSAGSRSSENFEYELENTPCKKVLELGRYLERADAKSRFKLPEILARLDFNSYLGVALGDSAGSRMGVMSVMSWKPLKDVGLAEATLNVFAARASAEMERLRSARALHATEMRNKAILNAIPDLMFVVDSAGRIIDYSANDQSELYARPEQFLGKSVHDVLPSDVAASISRTMENVSRSAESASYEYSLPMPDGANFYEARMVRLGEDKFLTIVRNVSSRKRAELALEESRRFTERITKTIPNVVFIYDLVERRNVYVNHRSWEILGYTDAEVLEMGDNFLTRTMHPEDLATLPKLAEQYGKATEGEVFENIFRLRHKSGEWRWVHRCATIFTKTQDGRPLQLIGTATDVTDLKKAEEELRRLSGHLLSAQDQERRRIARELHDGTAQNLFAISLNLELLQQRGVPASSANILADCQTLCDASLKELRTLSYLLHPPMLDQGGGLVAALGWYLEGFEKRSGISARLEVDAQLDAVRLPAALRQELFRIVQEALSNVVRHSSSSTAVVRLEKNDGEIILQIQDFGRGMRMASTDADVNSPSMGVGIPSMRERLRQVGGRLEVRSGDQGTTVVATVPFQAENSDPLASQAGTGS